MELGQECGLFARESAGALSAADYRAGIPLHDRQCRSAAAQSALAALVDQARAEPSAALGSVWARNTRVSASGKSEGACVYPAARERTRIGCRESFPFSTAGR